MPKQISYEIPKNKRRERETHTQRERRERDGKIRKWIDIRVDAMKLFCA